MSLAAIAIVLVTTVGGVPATASSASVDAQAAQTTSTSYFVDVPPGMPFRGEIKWLAWVGVSTGWADGTYRPYQPVTRDAMAAFMYRVAMGGTTPVTANSCSPDGMRGPPEASRFSARRRPLTRDFAGVPCSATETLRETQDAPGVEPGASSCGW